MEWGWVFVVFWLGVAAWGVRGLMLHWRRTRRVEWVDHQVDLDDEHFLHGRN